MASCLCLCSSLERAFALVLGSFPGTVPGSSRDGCGVSSCDPKGVPIMTMVSLTDCCRLLAIDPKTLHRCMSLSHLSAQPHPLDARLKCVTREQVQQLAVTHRRTLPESSEHHFQPETSAPSTPSDVIRASV